MSQYSKIDTQIVEQESLLKALNDLGYNNIEVHDQAQTSTAIKAICAPSKQTSSSDEDTLALKATTSASD